MPDLFGRLNVVVLESKLFSGGVMKNYEKVFCNKLGLLSADVWVVEPTYGLFYINLYGDEVRFDKFPKENVLGMSLYRSTGMNKEPDFRKYVTLKEGDIVAVRVLVCNVTSSMSILERASAISHRYLCYKGHGQFEETIVNRDMKFFPLS